MLDTQKATEKWGCAAQVQGTAQNGTSTDRPHGSAESIGGEVGDQEDALEVYLASQGTGGIPLWRDRAANGLKAPRMPLVEEFRSKVDAAEKQKP